MATRVLEESAQRVSDGVTELLRKQPFFGSLAFALREAVLRLERGRLRRRGGGPAGARRLRVA